MGALENHQIQVSVIIPTRNRKEVLRDAVESLGRQTLPMEQYEVIVVDNCSDDGTAELMQEMLKTLQCQLIYHVMEENRGPVRSRNTAARMARGKVLAFTDSDCRVPPEWLEKGLAAVNGGGANLGFVSGAVRDKPEQPIRFFSLSNDTGTSEDHTYRACNIFYPAEVFWNLGGFDEHAFFGQTEFMHYECADIDLAWRVKQKGYRSVYAEDVVVYHEVWKATPWEWLHKHTQLMPLALFLKRHPGLESHFLWWGPFSCRENLLFYLALIGCTAAAVGRLLMHRWAWAWAMLLNLPYLYYLNAVLKLQRGFRKPFRTAGQVIFFLLGQVVLTGSVLYGSLRARKFIL